MDFTALIDKLEELVGSARHLPMSNSIVINEHALYEVVDEMRHALPDELKQARWIVKERQEIVDEAEREAGGIIEDAKQKAESLVSDQEVVRLAEEKANEIIEAARAREREIRLGAEDYADEMLANLEVNLGKLLTAVQRGRDRLQGKVESR